MLECLLGRRFRCCGHARGRRFRRPRPRAQSTSTRRGGSRGAIRRPGSQGIDLGDGDDDPLDEVGHGTAVAGIVAAVCPRCSLLGVKIFNQQGIGTSYAVLRRLAATGIRWATNTAPA
jgi:subtilisin family serine protease